MRSKSYLPIICALAVTASLATAQLNLPKLKTKKVLDDDGPFSSHQNVILFIGDGMGQAVTDATAFQEFGQAEDGRKPRRLSFEQFPNTGMITTSAADSFVTDSAASATSMAAGVKTDNGMIGQLPDGTPTQTLADIAKEQGKSVGIVSSVSINHATPASFYAHNESRGNYTDIAKQLAENNHIDIALGGGLHSDKLFEMDLPKWAEDNKVMYITSADELAKAVATDQRVIGMFDKDNDQKLKYMHERDENFTAEPELSDLALTALKRVSKNDQGFFLMVEGGSIDWACHGNDIENATGEVKELHDTVEQVMDYLGKNDMLDNTLVIVTADHETGGLTMTGPYNEVVKGYGQIEFKWSTTGHSGVSVPIYATGPGSEAFNGKMNQTEVFTKARVQLK